jgi:hypothetical protein
MNNNVLIIDDLRNLKPEAALSYQNGNTNVIVARNSSEGLTHLQDDSVAYQSIYLDHDLGIVNGQLDNIMPVVDYLCERAFNDNAVKVAIVYVHTSNPVGGKQMMLSLARYGYNVQRIAPESIFTA